MIKRQGRHQRLILARSMEKGQALYDGHLLCTHNLFLIHRIAMPRQNRSKYNIIVYLFHLIN